MSESRRILIVRLSSLGDILHTLPAFQSLRSSFPDARIDWLVERRMAFLLDAVDGIDRALPIDTHAIRTPGAGADAWRRLWEPVRTMRRTRYDVAIDFQGLIKTAALSIASGARTRIGFSKPLVRERPAHWLYHRTAKKPASPLHVARLNLLLAAEAGAVGEELLVPLKSSPEDDLAITTRLERQKLSGFVVINPGGGWPTKRWQPERYAAVAEWIEKELSLRVIVTTGPGEDPLYQRISGMNAHSPPAHFAVPFLQLIPLFRAARLVLAGDTGPLHLACALGVPVVAIMGPTAPVRNGPWSGKDEVVVRHLPCSFCNARTCPTANECMDVSVPEVCAAVVRRLEGLR